MKNKKGIEFDELQVDTLKGIVDDQVSLKDSAYTFYAKAWKAWSANLESNSIYTRTPACFKNTEVFLYQFAKILVERFDCSVDTAIAELYSQYIYMIPPISSMLDVVSSNAKEALKRTMK